MKAGQTVIPEVIFLRAVACLCVILIHVTADPIYAADHGSRELLYYVTANQFARFSVPVFIFITGLTLGYRYRGSRDFRYATFLQKRLWVIGLPYLLWSLAYTIYLDDFEGRSLALPDLLSQLGKEVLLGTAAYHLYFVVLICQFYLLFPIFQWLFTRWQPRAVALAGLAVQGGLTIYAQYWARPLGVPVVDDLIYYLDRIFLLWVGYYTLGTWVAYNLDAWRAKAAAAKEASFILGLALWILLVGEFYLRVVYRGESLGMVITSAKPLVMLYALVSIPLLFYWGGRPGLIRRFNSVAEHSYGIYLTHPLAIWVFEHYMKNHHLVYSPVMVGLMYLFSLTAAYMATAGLAWMKPGWASWRQRPLSS